MTLVELAESLAGSPMRIHLLGVAGSGMSGIAALLLALGHRVSGSDRVDTVEIERLCKKGLDFHSPHTAEAVTDVDLVIYSSAIKAGNPAFDEAQRLGKPMFRRADALSAIMSAKKGVVICGMHGKTTTSAMMAHVLRAGGWKPSHYVGAEIPILGTNARWDSEGEYFVAEGDESDGTLINYHPEHAIVLNIEPEHLDFYRDLEAIDAVYTRLISQTAGKIIYCGDDAGASRVCAERLGSVSYGFGSHCRYRLNETQTGALGSRFGVMRGLELLGEIELNIPGRHNALNAMAVIAMAVEIGLPFESVAARIAGVPGRPEAF